MICPNQYAKLELNPRGEQVIQFVNGTSDDESKKRPNCSICTVATKCPRFPDLDIGHWKQPIEQKIQEGNTAILECPHVGTRIRIDRRRTCMRGGKWTDGDTHCYKACK